MSFNRADSTQGSIPSVCKHSLHCSVLENYTKFSSSNAATQVSSLPSSVLSDHSSRVFLPFLPFHSNLSETTILLSNSTLNILSVTDVTVITRLVSRITTTPTFLPSKSAPGLLIYSLTLTFDLLSEVPS